MDSIKPLPVSLPNRKGTNHAQLSSRMSAVDIADRKFREGMGKLKSDIHIAVMGVTGAGKSSLISLLCGHSPKIGHDLRACTSVVDVYTCNLYPGQNIYLVDTPGFDDTHRTDTEVLREIASWLTDSYKNDVKLNGIIYLHRISDIRMQGSARKNLMLFKKLCGEDALKNVILVTSMWDKVDSVEGQHREDQLKSTPEFWGWMMSRGSRTYRHNNSKKSAQDLLRHFLPMTKTVLALQDDMVNQKMTLDQTGAGRELEDDLAKEREKFARELLEAQVQMQEAIKQRDEDAMETIQELQREYEAHMKRLEKGRQELKISMEKLHQERYDQLEAKMIEERRGWMEIQETRQRTQDEKHRMEMELLRKQHRRELQRAEATIAELNFSQSREREENRSPQFVLVPKRSSQQRSRNDRHYSMTSSVQDEHPSGFTYENMSPPIGLSRRATEPIQAIQVKGVPDMSLDATVAARQLLYQAGYDMEARDFQPEAALYWAVQERQQAVVRLLFARGTDKDGGNTYGASILHWAATTGNEPVVRLLLNAGAHIETPDHEGATVLVLAASNGHEAVVKLLLDRDAQVNAATKKRHLTPLIGAAKNGHESVVRRLLKNGAKVNSTTDEGWTALHWAASTKRDSVVQLLLAKGLAVNARADDGKTPLHLAAEFGHERTAQLLLDNKADIKAKFIPSKTLFLFQTGCTPQQWAAIHKQEKVESLLKSWAERERLGRMLMMFT